MNLSTVCLIFNTCYISKYFWYWFTLMLLVDPIWIPTYNMYIDLVILPLLSFIFIHPKKIIVIWKLFECKVYFYFCMLKICIFFLFFKFNLCIPHLLRQCYFLFCWNFSLKHFPFSSFQLLFNISNLWKVLTSINHD